MLRPSRAMFVLRPVTGGEKGPFRSEEADEQCSDEQQEAKNREAKVDERYPSWHGIQITRIEVLKATGVVRPALRGLRGIVVHDAERPKGADGRYHRKPKQNRVRRAPQKERRKAGDEHV